MVSIIIPVYNVEKYLRQCLDSVFNQTYKDIEVIIVNDGSTDNSIDIINEYREKHANIIYVEQQNSGQAQVRNLAIKYAKGEFILYVDSDDYLDNNMVELLHDKAIETGSNIVICGHNEIYEDIKGKDTSVFVKGEESKIYSGVQVADMLLSCSVMGVLWDKLFRRSLLLKDDFHFESGRYTEDWYPVFKHISKANTIAFVNKTLYNYRLRSTSSTNKQSEKKLDDYVYAISNILYYIENSGMEVNKNSMNMFNIITFNNIINIYYNLNSKDGHKVYRKCRELLYSNFEPELKDLIETKNIGKGIRINILLWKFKVFHLGMKLGRCT